MNETKTGPSLSEFQADDVELAHQLLSLRQEPGPALRQRVQAIPRSPGPAVRWSPARLAWLAGALLAVGLLFASPPARAMLGRVERVFGQVHLLVQDAWFDDGAAVRVVLRGTPMTLAEAQARLPFELKMPAYVPPGLTAASDTVSLLDPELALVEMQWRDAKGGVVQLTARPARSDSDPVQTLVGPDSGQPVLINGQAGVLVRGGWDGVNQVWSHQEAVTMLIWNVGDVQYRLLAASKVMMLEELIAMAASIR